MREEFEKERYTENSIRKFLNEIPDEFKILEEQIDPGIQEEYFKLSDSINIENYSEKEILMESEKLFNKSISHEYKKKIMVLLAHLGTVKSYRIIERYIKKSKDELKEWSLLSIHECKMYLESSLLDESKGLYHQV